MVDVGYIESVDMCVCVLFYVIDFGNGGIELFLIQWLCIFDCKCFRVILLVMYVLLMLMQCFCVLILDDIFIEILVCLQWFCYFQDCCYVCKFDKVGWIVCDFYGVFVVCLYIGWCVVELVCDVDVIVDYDLLLWCFVGCFGVVWIGVNYFSFVVWFGGCGWCMCCLFEQYSCYDSIVVLNLQMGDEVDWMFGDWLQ